MSRPAESPGTWNDLDCGAQGRFWPAGIKRVQYYFRHTFSSKHSSLWRPQTGFLAVGI